MAARTTRQSIIYQVQESKNAIADCKEHITMALTISEGHNSIIISHYPALMDMINGVDNVLGRFLQEVKRE